MPKGLGNLRKLTAIALKLLKVENASYSPNCISVTYVARQRREDAVTEEMCPGSLTFWMRKAAHISVSGPLIAPS